MWARAAGRTCEEEGSQSGAPLGASPETEGADMTLTEETLMVRGVRGDEDGVEDVRDGEVEDLMDGLETGVEDGDVRDVAGDMTCQVC